MDAAGWNYLRKLELAHARYKFIISPEKTARFRSIQDFKQPSNKIFPVTVGWLIADKDAVTLTYDFDGFISLILKDVSIQIIAYHVLPSW
jgi:hypothetical protein